MTISFFIKTGELQKLIDEGVRGITSNPTIFEKAIAGSSDYSSALEDFAKADKSIEEIYEMLAINDLGKAADLFRTVYDTTNGLDGWISLEVSSTLAHDTEKIIQDARRLFVQLSRPNVMIKVSATPEGISAITHWQS